MPFADLAFLRPAWLLALLVLPLLAWAWRWRARRRSPWQGAVDPHLLPHLLAGGAGGRGASIAGGCVLAGLAVVILALAGPSWRSVPQPLQGGGGALVIAVDLSSAALANDLPPSRLAQARARIEALLRAYAGEAGLVAYAEDAFVVSPVTPDAANVVVFLDALAPDVMPVDGDRPDRAIDQAVELLAQSGHPDGSILLLAPAATPAAQRAATRAAAAGHRVSVLAMGTPAGAGYRGRDGAIHRSALDMASLRALAAAGGGRVHDWETPTDSIARALDDGGTAEGSRSEGRVGGAGLVAEDGGYWLLPLAMLLLLFAFRRGGVLAAVALCLLVPVQPGFAAGAGPLEAQAWRRADQVAHARSVEAEAAYRAGEYEAAARGFAGLPGADAAYNRGNALARAGRYEAAIAAYDEALEASPGMPDAVANRAAVEAAMRRQPPPGGGGSGGDGGPPLGGGDAQGETGGGNRGETGEDDGDPRTDDAEAGELEGDAGGDADADAGQSPPDTAASDPAGQQAADDAQREAMQRALDAAGGAPGDGDAEAAASATQAPTADRERDQANAAWLRRVPDDPGALLRARFRSEHLRRRAEER